jgi:hypothetical protein
VGGQSRRKPEALADADRVHMDLAVAAPRAAANICVLRACNVTQVDSEEPASTEELANLDQQIHAARPGHKSTNLFEDRPLAI